MSQQKYKPFVVRLGTTDKFGDIQIPQDEEDEQEYDAPERYRKYFKIKNDWINSRQKSFRKSTFGEALATRRRSKPTKLVI